MTQQQFLLAHLFNIPGVNITGTINLHIEPNRSASNTGDYIIIGCTIPTIPKSSDLSTSEVVNVLKQIERIKFNIQNNNQNDQIILEIINKSEKIVQNTTSFFYFTVTPTFIKNSVLNKFLVSSTSGGAINITEINTSQTELQDTYRDVSISFEPFITNLQFGFSEFNAIISNAIDARSSNRIVESDRDTSTIIPSNFEAIISGSANPAEIQDSLYSSTGWSNSRYNGTKTTSLTYGKIPPTITGRLFIGEQYTLNTSSSNIFNAPFDSRVTENLLHSGEEKLPEIDYKVFRSGSESLEVIATTTDVINAQDVSTNITINYEEYINANQELKQGDIIEIDQIPFYINSTNNNTITLSGNYKGFNLNQNTTGDSNIKVINPDNRIYTFLGETSKIQSVSDSKVWIQETNEIVATNEFGTIIYKQITG